MSYNNIKYIKKLIRIAQAERDTSKAKSELHKTEGHYKSAMVYAIRYEALDLYIQQLHKQLLAKEAKENGGK